MVGAGQREGELQAGFSPAGVGSALQRPTDSASAVGLAVRGSAPISARKGRQHDPGLPFPRKVASSQLCLVHPSSQLR